MDVIVPDQGGGGNHDARIPAGGNFVVFDRPAIGHVVEGRMPRWGMLRITRFRMVT